MFIQREVWGLYVLYKASCVIPSYIVTALAIWLQCSHPIGLSFRPAMFL